MPSRQQCLHPRSPIGLDPDDHLHPQDRISPPNWYGARDVLAEIVRVDRAAHRRMAGDSAVAEQVKISARAHQSTIWTRATVGEHTALDAT